LKTQAEEGTMFRKILVPVDGSTTAAAGLAAAIQLAALARASVRLVHVIDAFPAAAPPLDEASWQLIVEAMRNQGQAVLDNAEGQVKAAGVPVSQTLIEFPPMRVADALVDAAKEADCDLVVMGTHGRRGVKRWVLGSDAERVLRSAACPVLMIRPPASARED
jgi:nucleotide-binding universal stress UspA family protein